MTSISHQLAGLVCGLWLLTAYPTIVGLVVGSLSVVALMVGALTPDIDQPTANLWRRLLGARAAGNIFQWFSGGHRHMTHSVIGILVIGYGTHWLATHLINAAYVSGALAVWRAYMVGYISHLLADTITDHGVPWLWPLKINFKIPPGPEEVRVTTNSFVERVLVRGALSVVILLLLLNHGAVVGHYFGW